MGGAEEAEEHGHQLPVVFENLRDPERRAAAAPAAHPPPATRHAPLAVNAQNHVALYTPVVDPL